MNCTFIGTSLVDAFKTLSGTDCGTGEKCRYKVSVKLCLCFNNVYGYIP